MSKWTEGGKTRYGFAIKKPEWLNVPYPVIYVKVGDVGFWQASEADDLPDDVIESAIAGSMFGWNTPAAQRAIEFAKNM